MADLPFSTASGGKFSKARGTEKIMEAGLEHLPLPGVERLLRALVQNLDGGSTAV